MAREGGEGSEGSSPTGKTKTECRFLLTQQEAKSACIQLSSIHVCMSMSHVCACMHIANIRSCMYIERGCIVYFYHGDGGHLEGQIVLCLWAVALQDGHHQIMHPLYTQS